MICPKSDFGLVTELPCLDHRTVNFCFRVYLGDFVQARFFPVPWSPWRQGPCLIHPCLGCSAWHKAGPHMFTELDSPANFMLVPLREVSAYINPPSFSLFPHIIFFFFYQKRNAKWCHLLRFRIYVPSFLVYVHEVLLCLEPLTEK